MAFPVSLLEFGLLIIFITTIRRSQNGESLIADLSPDTFSGYIARWNCWYFFIFFCLELFW
jgi:hypothetical protein